MKDEKVTLQITGDQLLIQTPDGHYLTAIYGVGVSGSRTVAIHTGATSVGVDEVFTMQPY